MGRSTFYLYLTGQGLQVLHELGRRLQAGPFFAATSPLDPANGPQAFDTWLRAHRHADYRLIIDVAEETFACEEIPLMGRRDTALYLRRRIEQRFRDACFSLWAVMHRPRRPVRPSPSDPPPRSRVALAVIPRTEALAPWLTVLESAHVALLGVYSPGQLALRLCQGPWRAAHALLIAWTPAGLRQTVVSAGEIVFSRLSPMTGPVTQDVLQSECSRTVQYLLMAKQITREQCDSDQLKAYLLQGGVADWTELPARLPLDASLSVALCAIADTPPGQALHAQVGALPHWCAATRLAAQRGSPRRGYAQGRWAHGARQRDWERGLGWSALATGVLAASLLAGVALLERYWPADTAATQAARASATQAQAALHSELAAYPASGRTMHDVVTLSAHLRGRHVAPLTVMQPLALDDSAQPDLRLERLSWRRLTPAQHTEWTSIKVGSSGTELSNPRASGLDSAAPGAGTSAGGGATTPLGAGMAMGATSAGPDSAAPQLGPVVVEVSGLVTPRQGLEAANQQVLVWRAAVAARCACPVQIMALPFDPAADTPFNRSFEATRTHTEAHARPFEMRYLLPAAAGQP